MKTIASRFWDNRNPVFYVANLPEKNPITGTISDWGYTTKPAEAINLSAYWRKRFNADCNRVGVKANFLEFS